MRGLSRYLLRSVIVICFLPVLTFLAAAQGFGMMGPQTNLPGYQGHELNENMIVPQFAVGQHYTTSMVLYNMGNMVQMPWLSSQTLKLTGEIYFYRPDGSQFPVSINGGSPVSKYSFTLDASKSVSLEMVSSGLDASGWALIKIDDANNNYWGMMNGHQMMRANRIMATVYYTYKEGGQIVSRAGVIPSIYEMSNYLTSITPVQVQDGINTGIAIVNTGSQSAVVKLTLRNANGDTIATRQLQLPAGNQFARFIDEAQLFKGAFTGSMYGFLQMDSSSEGVVAMGMLLTGGILTTIPTHHYGSVSMMP